jgi:hypothetical protein
MKANDLRPHDSRMKSSALLRFSAIIVPPTRKGGTMSRMRLFLCFAVSLGWTIPAVGDTVVLVFRGAEKDSPDVAEVKSNIRKNKWWAKRPLPDKTFEAIIKEITRHKKGLVFINNQGKFAYCKGVSADPRKGLYSMHKAADEVDKKVRALGRKRIVVTVTPRRMEAIFHVDDALSGDDYESLSPKKPGPAKGPKKKDGKK